jgi:hypothetical protein
MPACTTRYNLTTANFQLGLCHMVLLTLGDQAEAERERGHQRSGIGSALNTTLARERRQLPGS